MKQKLALACTLIHEPEVIFLDEPTTGVDPVSRREFWRILYSLLDRGVTIFVSTPYMDEAERCHRVGFMSKGRLIACDEPERLKTLVEGELLEIAAQPRRQAHALMNNIPEVKSAVVFGGVLHVLVKDAQKDANRIAARLLNQQIEVLSMRKIKPSIEDVFILLSSAPQSPPAKAAGGSRDSVRRPQ
jgi:ABC-2 type transport system ATP-binding protein